MVKVTMTDAQKRKMKEEKRTKYIETPIKKGKKTQDDLPLNTSTPLLTILERKVGMGVNWQTLTSSWIWKSLTRQGMPGEIVEKKKRRKKKKEEEKKKKEEEKKEEEKKKKEEEKKKKEEDKSG